MSKLPIALCSALCLVAFLMSISYEAQARDEKKMFPLEAALSSADGQNIANGDIQFFFGDDNHPSVARVIGNWQSNRKSNGVGRSDATACNRAFSSALLSLKDRALREGGDAVVNIVSFYKRDRVSSETEYECGAGNIMVGVTLKGDVVELE